MHIEIKLMQTGQSMELSGLRQATIFCFLPKTLDCGLTIFFGSSTPQSWQVHCCVLLHRQTVLVTRSVLSSSLKADRLGSRGQNGTLPFWSVPRRVQRLWDCLWPMPHLLISSPVGPVWPGFPLKVLNLDSEAGLAGSTSWLLHSLPGHTKNHTGIKNTGLSLNFMLLIWICRPRCYEVHIEVFEQLQNFCPLGSMLQYINNNILNIVLTLYTIIETTVCKVYPRYRLFIIYRLYISTAYFLLIVVSLCL